MTTKRKLFLSAAVLIVLAWMQTSAGNPPQSPSPLLAQAQTAPAMEPAPQQPEEEPAAPEERQVAPQPEPTLAPNATSAPQESEQLPSAAPAQNQTQVAPPGVESGAVIWHPQQDIASLDLYYGQGGRKHLPEPPFTFVREDMHGSSPKFDAHDGNRRKWRVKLGAESQPEVVASRLLWAVGYFVNDDYVLPQAQVRGLTMKRHSPKQRGTTVYDARFARKPRQERKIGSWKWKNNPFFGTREFNGLRVMMALLNSWDLKDDNNAIYQDPQTHQRIYLVSDVGSTFGTSGRSWTSDGSKGQPDKYKESRFIVRNTGTEVDFATPAAAGSLLAESFGFAAPRFLQYERQKWIGKNIPNPDAHWIGTLLGQLSHQQLVDAFRAGNFSDREIDIYVPVLEKRIEELKGI